MILIEFALEFEKHGLLSYPLLNKVEVTTNS